jgi:uncharacterized phage protein (TIGR01671 family)
MNREIKFRAWNTEMKHMVFPSLEFGREIWPCTYKRIIKSETNENGDTVELILEMVSVDHILQSPEFEVMQYTGLPDKNGVDIYEGDIVFLREFNRKYVVKFHKGCFKLFHADPKLNDMIWGTIERVEELGRSIEIIGNIHENPELIKL